MRTRKEEKASQIIEQLLAKKAAHEASQSIGQAIFLLGAAGVHACEMLKERNQRQPPPYVRKLPSSGISWLWGYK